MRVRPNRIVQDKEQNKTVVRDFLKRCFMGREFGRVLHYFKGNEFLRHDKDDGHGLKERLALMKRVLSKA